MIARPGPDRLEADGLYDPASPKAAERIELIEWLLDHGVPYARIQACNADDIEGLAGDVTFERGEYDLDDLASMLGWTRVQVVGVFNQLGIAPEPTLPIYDEGDLAFLRTLDDFGASAPQDIAPEILRVSGSSLARIAETGVAGFVQDMEQAMIDAGATEREKAEVVHATSEAGLRLGAGLAAVFRHHLRAAVALQRAGMRTSSSRELMVVGIGFVDLVGFTSLSQSMTPSTLSDVVRRFEQQALDEVVEHGGRVVKHIGDEVMFVAAEAAAVCDIAAHMLGAFAGDPSIQPRGGLTFGEVLWRGGDYYGPLVNLAARLVDAAIPGEVLADDGLVEAVGAGSGRFEPAGRRQLKGFDEPVRVHSLVPRG